MTERGGAVPPIVATVRALMREIESDPTRPLRLADLARRSGYSATYLQRRFTAIAGSSPKAFQTAARMRRLKRELRSGSAITTAINVAGFGSPSRLYERSAVELGMTPSEYRKGGAGLTISYATAPTPLGLVMIGATLRGICSLAFGVSADVLLRDLRREFPAATLHPMPAAGRRELRRWMAALRAHLRGQKPDTSLPVDLQGSAFQVLVWRYLRTIPRGNVQSYAEVAAGLGRPGAARAVARACATNHIAVFIPCHRVICGDGSLAGYRWGLKRKRALLQAELPARKSRHRAA